MLWLGWLGAIDCRIDQLTRAPNWEFFAWLRRGAVAELGALTAEAFEARRVTLLKRSLLGIQEQIDWRGGAPSLPSSRFS